MPWGDHVFMTQIPYDQTVFSGRQIVARNLYSGENVTGGPTAEMYRTSIVLGRKPFFDPMLEFGDTDAAFRTLLTHDLGFVHQVVAYERQQGGTRITGAFNMGAGLSEHLLFIVRYGRSVLDEKRYRAALRRQIQISAVWHLKQAIRPSRLSQPEFFNYHEQILRYLSLANRDNDREVAAHIRFVGALLSRRRLRRLHPSYMFRSW